jgi:hypothetical protein
MKCYVVTASSGSYEDYRKWNERIFLSEPSAEKYKEDYNSKIREIKRQGMICDDCIASTQNSEDLTKEDFDALNLKCTYDKKDLKNFEYQSGFWCNNQMYLFDWRDTDEARVEEFELYE